MTPVKQETEDFYQTFRAPLDHAYSSAEAAFIVGRDPELNISPVLRACLQEISDKSVGASSAFTALVTCLAVKAARPDLDARYHQTQIGAPFSFRTISEKVVYPWLSSHEFEGAKSGFQTRTIERPKPFTLDYSENIKLVKEPFLQSLNEIEVNKQSPSESLTFLIHRQILLRESNTIELAEPAIDDVSLISSYFATHFFSKYKVKGAARLPVLALYAIYEVMLGQLKRYEGKTLLPLQSHSAADEQTGAIGDIEIESVDSRKMFEGVEVKHDIRITPDLLDGIARKISAKSPERYYVLTTHRDCQPDTETVTLLRDIHTRIGTQVIVNGVIPTIKYYLRLLAKPGAIFPRYIQLLKSDAAISFEHREAWNLVVTGKIPTLES